MKKVLTKVCNITTTVIVILSVLIAAALYIPRLFGAKPYYVLSGSMMPTFPAGSVIYVNESVKANDLKEGDVLTFRAGGSVVTHRVIELEKDGDNVTSITTKGDANKNTTETVKPSEVIGRATNFGIPLLGYVAYVIQAPWGKFLLIGIAALIVFLMILPSIFGDDEDNEKEGSEETEKA